jgi:hypothetical protein
MRQMTRQTAEVENNSAYQSCRRFLTDSECGGASLVVRQSKLAATGKAAS